ncbi:extracellular solute-binding protein [Roseibium salinum]|nr:extracellular solute-binding protein [Roseibium salinum]
MSVIPVSESDLGTRATAAFAAGDLPDVIYHTVQYALPWAEAGILDTEAATEVFEKLGADTFAPGAVAMASVEDGIASVPVDGWTQMVVYRKDLFEENGLAAPDSYEDILAAVEKAAQSAGNVRVRRGHQGRRELHEPGAGACIARQRDLPGRRGGLQAAGRKEDRRGAGVLQGHSRGITSGGSLLEAVA